MFSSWNNVISHIYVFPRKKKISIWAGEVYQRNTGTISVLFYTGDYWWCKLSWFYLFYFFGQRTQYCGRTPARPNTWWVERWGSARQPTQYPTTSVILVIHQHPWWSTGACMTSLLPFLFSFVRKAANTVPHDIGDPGNTSASLVIDWCMRDLLATLSLFICLQGSQHCTPRHRWSW